MKIVCQVTRAGKVESYHQVYAIAIDGEGKNILTAGKPDYITCVRSALKPFQASAAIKEGATEEAGFKTEEIALMCASHNGEEIHVKTAKGMAKKLGIGPSHYECGIHAPHDKVTREKEIKSNTIFTPFHNNCSGKHSGMLSLAKKLKTNYKGYTEIDHPVQQTIFQQLRELIGEKQFSFGIDGCSAPTPFLSLKSVARLFQKLGSEKYPELIEAYRAMSKHPYLIGGNNRFDTEFNYALNGRGVCKAGGEAIRGVVIKTKQYGLMGLAIKVLDGNQRAIDVATMATIKYLNVLKKEENNRLVQYESKKLFNHRDIYIGDIKAEIKD